MMSHYTMWLVFVAMFGENIPEAINNEEKKVSVIEQKGIKREKLILEEQRSEHGRVTEQERCNSGLDDWGWWVNMLTGKE